MFFIWKILGTILKEFERNTEKRLKKPNSRVYLPVSFV
jgi:hypothetical protein